MSSRPAIPHGYAVVQLDDKQWYPLEVTRYYSAANPDGNIALSSYREPNEDKEFRDVRFAHREDALRYVQQRASNDESNERRKWESISIESDLYPEQCVHALTLIEEITGHPPKVRRWLHSVYVEIPSYPCSCGKYHLSYWDSSQITIEDALQRAAEYVYEHRCSCTATSAHEYEQRQAA